MADTKIKYALLGIDFGTSTSVLCVQYYDVNGNRVGDVFCEEIAGEVPTVIFEEETTGNCYFGKDAIARAKLGEGELVRNFKLGLASSDPQVCAEAEKRVRQFFAYLFKLAKMPLNVLVEKQLEIRTILSVPVKWSAKVKEFMRAVAYETGFAFGAAAESIRVIDEPNAAVYAVILPRLAQLQGSGVLNSRGSSNVMMVDMGAGTTDVTVFKMQFKSGVPVVVDGSVHVFPPPRYAITCGGREIDDLLATHYHDNCHSKKSLSVIADRIKPWKETELSAAIRRGERTEFYCGGQELSLDSQEFFKITRVHWRQWHDIIVGALREAGVSARDIDLLMLTGGHSNWRFFLEEYFRGKGFCQLVPPDFVKLKNQPAERILACEVNRSQTVARGIVLADCAFKFQNIAEADYWVVPEVGGVKRDGVLLCKKGEVLPLTKNEECVYKIESHLFRCARIAGNITVYRGEAGKWSEKLWEFDVSVPVTEKILRFVFGPLLVGVTMVVDLAKLIGSGDVKFESTRSALREKYGMKVKYEFAVNDVGAASGVFRMYADDDSLVGEKTYAV